MFKEGDRIVLNRMGDDPDPIPSGTKGTVVFCSFMSFDKTWQVVVNWDNGRKLNLVCPPDSASLIR